MRLDMVHAYVRDLLERLCGARSVPDQDGDYPVTCFGALFYVRVTNPSDPVVQVFSVAVDDIAGSAELYEAINKVNVRLRFARAFHVQGQVLIESEIWACELNPANFEHACRNVAAATDEHGTDLITRFGGIPRFELSKQLDGEGNVKGQSVGLYL